MAADFLQERQDLALNYSLQCSTEHPAKPTSDPPSTTKYFCGEIVMPGVGPGVLISSTRVWREGKEMVTEVGGLFPAGVVDHITPGTTELVIKPSLGGRIWEVVCSATMLTFGMAAKLVLRGLNTTVVHGRENMDTAWERDSNKSLLSVINHQSCFDDPGIWGAVLRPGQLADIAGMRWGASASEVIFANRALASFWSLGKVVPILRRWGVKQPEARVNADGGYIRHKWGVGLGRLMWDCA